MTVPFPLMDALLGNGLVKLSWLPVGLAVIGNGLLELVPDPKGPLETLSGLPGVMDGEKTPVPVRWMPVEVMTPVSWSLEEDLNSDPDPVPLIPTVAEDVLKIFDVREVAMFWLNAPVGIVAASENREGPVVVPSVDD